MKNKFLKIFTTLIIFTLISGCNFHNSSSLANEESLSSSESSESIENSLEISSSSELTHSSSSEESSSVEESSSSEESSSEDFEIVGDEKSITFSGSTSVSGISQYNTGGYCYLYSNSFQFELYRTYRNSSSDFSSFIPKETLVDVNSLGGAFYNVTPINYIESIEIEYRCSSDSILSYGKTRDNFKTYTIPASNQYVKETVSIDYASYFNVETLSSTLYLKTITINYIDNGDKSYASYIRSGEGEYRLNPVVYQGTLISQQSYVDVPIDVTYTNDAYVVNKTKRYTYYSYSDVIANPSLVEKASYTDPMDVANYFIAFKTYPANYVYKKNYNTAYQTFNKYTRCVSDYSRTDGYATKVPCAMVSGRPHYYECDIALSTSYSSGNRGVGRLVVWEYGFTCQGYDSSIVAVYTDDHYATFSEFLNDGTFGIKFNAEKNRTAYVHGGSLTID